MKSCSGCSNAYTLSYATFLLSAGALSDRIGARATFLWGFAIFLAASLVCGAAPNFLILTLARVAQGLGAALLVPSAMALLQRAFPESRERAKAVGLWAGSGSLAIAAGPLVGGALISLVGWRTIFLMNVPIGIIGIWLTLRLWADPAREDEARFRPCRSIYRGRRARVPDSRRLSCRRCR